MKNRTISLSLLIVFTTMTMVACGTASLSTNSSISNPSASLPAPTQVAPSLSQGSMPAGSGDLLAAFQATLENIYNTVGPSVVNIRVVQELMGHADVKTTEIYPHVMEKDISAVFSPLDRLC